MVNTHLRELRWRELLSALPLRSVEELPLLLLLLLRLRLSRLRLRCFSSLLRCFFFLLCLEAASLLLLLLLFLLSFLLSCFLSFLLSFSRLERFSAL